MTDGIHLSHIGISPCNFTAKSGLNPTLQTLDSKFTHKRDRGLAGTAKIRPVRSGFTDEL